MANTEVRAHYEAIKKSGDKLIDASTEWGRAGDDVWWAQLPGRALGQAGDYLIPKYQEICRDVNAELRDGSRTLGMAAAGLWKVADAYEDNEDEARERVLKARGFDLTKIPGSYW